MHMADAHGGMNRRRLHANMIVQFRKCSLATLANRMAISFCSALQQRLHGFEGILLRQFLSESMKPLLQGGAGGQVYGYLITESLSSSLVKGGGLGLSSVIQAQLSPKTSR